jgi:2-polyprenyl-6-methoxyphenol hydroxylase-like FAD-dependent oxidoreductase
MSSFKGHGANTALADAATLGGWVSKRPTCSALACYEREMAAKAGKRVAASRGAALALLWWPEWGGIRYFENLNGACLQAPRTPLVRY